MDTSQVVQVVKEITLDPPVLAENERSTMQDPSRLNRDQSGSHGTKKYAFEELVAELSSAFSCASLGIVPTVRHADYIGAWLDVLREDNRAVVRAASQASKAADFLLSFIPDSVASAPSDSVVDDWEAA